MKYKIIYYQLLEEIKKENNNINNIDNKIINEIPQIIEHKELNDSDDDNIITPLSGIKPYYPIHYHQPEYNLNNYNYQFNQPNIPIQPTPIGNSQIITNGIPLTDIYPTILPNSQINTPNIIQPPITSNNFNNPTNINTNYNHPFVNIRNDIPNNQPIYSLSKIDNLNFPTIYDSTIPKNDINLNIPDLSYKIQNNVNSYTPLSCQLPSNNVNTLPIIPNQLNYVINTISPKGTIQSTPYKPNIINHMRETDKNVINNEVEIKELPTDDLKKILQESERRRNKYKEII